MQRQRRSHYRTPSYSREPATSDRRGFLRQLGALAGVSAAVAAGPACPLLYPPLSGDIAYPDELVTVTLPEGETPHRLFFGDEGQVDYFLDVQVQGWEPAEYLRGNAEGVLDSCDEALAGHSLTELDPEADLGALQDELLALIAAAYYGDADAGTGVFYAVTLRVVERVVADLAKPA